MLYMFAVKKHKYNKETNIQSRSVMYNNIASNIFMQN